MVDEGRNCSSDALRIEILRSVDVFVSGTMKRFRQFDRAQHVCDALDVVRHLREADFDPCTGQPTHQQTWMSKDAVLDRREGMLDGRSA